MWWRQLQERVSGQPTHALPSDEYVEHDKYVDYNHDQHHSHGHGWTFNSARSESWHDGIRWP